MDAGRNEIFQRLKPHCVQLSQVALIYGRNPSTGKELIASLKSLKLVLAEVATPDSAFDTKLSDYVFFPLSHVFKQSQQIPAQALEEAVSCLTYILQSGWSCELPVEVGRQLQILLTFIAGGNPAKKDHEPVSEELRTAAFVSLSALFTSFARSSEESELTATANIPTLGHVVTVMLDGIEGGASPEVQLPALSAFRSFQLAVRDKEALVNFFPYTVSTLTKTLLPVTKSRRSWKVLEGCLDALSTALEAVLEDSHLNDISVPTDKSPQEMTTEAASRESWLKATASQVKLALANVVKLRQHGRAEVRRGLLRLCLVVLESCRVSLSESTPMMVETLIGLAGESSTEDEIESESALKHLSTADTSTLDSVKSSLHDWIVALPRVMQSPDDTKKRRVIKQVSTSFRLLSSLGADSNLVDDLLATSLRDGVTAAIRASSKSRITQHGDLGDSTGALILGAASGEMSTFPPVLFAHEGQRETLQDLQQFLKQLGGTSASLIVVRQMLAHVQHASGDELLACLWLSLELLRYKKAEDDVVGDFIDFGRVSDLRTDLLEELYSYSVSSLIRPWDDSGQDWRLQSLALEVVALQAQQLKVDFRIELVDALYPAVHLIGSTQPALREHAMVCLNIVARSCGYTAASELIIDNVDYLVNAVALKLNTFDISPQAPQVLLMMIRLTGPSLLPYLDDLVGSVFTALESFHGYPRLVELLFSALQGIVEEASRSDVLLLTSGADVDHGKKGLEPLSLEEVAEHLSAQRERATQGRDLTPEPAPHEPWASKPADNDEPPLDPNTQIVEPEKAPPQSKIFNMTLSIARLTQHYLTHASPSLRLSLLHLASTAMTPLARHEDSFLPLINDLWPGLSARLYDEETYVAAAAADAIAALCRGAGDFLTGRLEAEWIARLGPLVKRVQADIRGRQRAGRPAGGFLFGRTLWDALVRLLVSMLSHVRVDDEVVDEVLAITADLLPTEPALREALEGVNPDAVWLCLWQQGKVLLKAGVPVLEGAIFRVQEAQQLHVV